LSVAEVTEAATIVSVEQVRAVTTSEGLAALTVPALSAATEVMVVLRRPVLEPEVAEAILRLFPAFPERTVC
jgi:hypothetical protein